MLSVLSIFSVNASYFFSNRFEFSMNFFVFILMKKIFLENLKTFYNFLLIIYLIDFIKTFPLIFHNNVFWGILKKMKKIVKLFLKILIFSVLFYQIYIIISLSYFSKLQKIKSILIFIYI